MLGAKSSPYSSGKGGTCGSWSTNRTPALLNTVCNIFILQISVNISGFSCLNNPITFLLPFGELLDHVVSLIDEHLNAEAIVHSGERGSEYLCSIWIVGRVEGVTCSIGRRVCFSPVAEANNDCRVAFCPIKIF